MGRALPALWLGCLLGCGPAPSQPLVLNKAKVEEPSVAAKTPGEQILGTWEIELSEQDKGEFRALRLALKNPPPTEAELEAAGLDHDQRATVAFVLMTRSESPDSPQLASIRQVLASLEDTKVTVTPERFDMRLGVADVSVRYTVVEAQGDRLRLRTTSDDGRVEESVILLRGPDAFEYRTAEASPGDAMRFRRAG